MPPRDPAAQQAASALFGWVSDRNGQVGDGSGTYDATPVHPKLPVGTAVAAGSRFSLALTSDGVHVTGVTGNGPHCLAMGAPASSHPI